MGAVVIFYMVLMFPSGTHPPVRMDKESVSLEECLDDVRYILERANPEWPNGTAMQAGCVVRLPDRTEAR